MRASIIAWLLLFVAAYATAQSGAKNGEWRCYGGDIGNTRYSPLDQINAANFEDLAIAWRFKIDSFGPPAEYQFEGTPLMVHGVVFTTAGSRRAVVVLDGATGEMLRMHNENEGARGSNAPRQLAGRGLGLNIPRTWRPGMIGTLVTKTLVIAGGGWFCDCAFRPARGHVACV